MEKKEDDGDDADDDDEDDAAVKMTVQLSSGPDFLYLSTRILHRDACSSSLCYFACLCASVNPFGLV